MLLKYLPVIDLVLVRNTMSSALCLATLSLLVVGPVQANAQSPSNGGSSAPFVYGALDAPSGAAPAGLILTWTGDPTSSIVIDWHRFAADAGRPAEIQFRPRGSDEWVSYSAERFPFPFSDRLIDRVEITGLEPASAYEFRGSADERTYWFRTMPTTLDGPLVYASGGDVRHEEAWMSSMNQAVMAHDPEFIVWGGDLAYADGLENRLYRWYQFMNSMVTTLVSDDGRVPPVLAGIGNHEIQGGYHRGRISSDADRLELAPYYFTLFAFPGLPGYGVVDFGDYLSLVFPDTDHANPMDGEQLVWLNETLQARPHVPHLAPVYHLAAYPSNRDFNSSRHRYIRENWVPLFEQQGVRVAYEHHDHTYKRTVPIFQQEENAEEGIVFIGDGAWGVRTRPVHSVEDTWYLEVAQSLRHALIVTMYPDRKEIEAIRADGSTIDTVTVPSRVIAPAMVVDKGGSVIFGGGQDRFAAIPGTPVERTFEVRNLSTSPEDLELTGAPDAVIFEESGTTSHGGFSISANLSGGTLLEPGESASFTVLFTPGDLGTHSATVMIPSNDPRTSPYRFTVTAEVFAEPVPIMSVFDLGREVQAFDTINLGTKIIGDSRSKTFTVRNDPIALADLVLEGPDPSAVVVFDTGTTTSGEFIITDNIPGTAATIPAGGSASFTVAISTEEVGSQSATVVLLNNDPARDPFEFDVAAEVLSGSRVGVSLMDGIWGTTQHGAEGYRENNSSGTGLVGVGGSSGSRYSNTPIAGFTLPTLPPGHTILSVTIHYQIDQIRMHDDEPFSSRVYLLNTENPRGTDLLFYYHGPEDTRDIVRFAGEEPIPYPGDNSTTNLNPPLMAAHSLEGPALELFRSYYAEEAPSQMRAFFRFNRSTETLEGLGGRALNRFTIGTSPSVLFLDIATRRDPYLGWADGAAFGADGSGDGVANGLAWVLGAASPANDARSLLPTVQVLEGDGDDDLYLFSFSRRREAMDDPDTEIEVEYSNNLVNWFVATETTEGVDIDVIPDGDFDEVEVRVGRSTLSPNGEPLFFRLRVHGSPSPES